MEKLIPVLSEKEKEGMVAYYTVYEKYADVFSKQAREDLKDHPIFGEIIRKIPKDASDANDKLTRHLQKQAIVNDNWLPYIEHQIQQGVIYAKMGLEFSSWYEVVALVRNYLTPYLYKEYGNSERFFDALNGMNSFMDIAMGIIGKAYMREKEEIIQREQEKIKKLNIELEQRVKEISDYQYALDESSIVAITDQKGIIKKVNGNFCAISKYSRNELIGQDHRIINSGYHSKEFIRDLWVTIANGKIWKGELKNKAKDGTTYWVDTTIIPFLNEHGKPFQYVAIRSDITERKQSEIEIKKLNEELEQSLKEITDYQYALDESSIVAITDQKGIIKRVNENFCAISKYSQEELIGQDHRIINSGYHSKEFIRELWVTIANGKIWKGELKNKAKDGTVYWVDTTIIPFLNDQGKPFQYVAIRSDITERKKSEIEIKKLNEELEQSLKEITDYQYALDESSIVAITDQKGIIKRVNENFCAISKYSQEELIGQDHRIVNSGYHPKEFIRDLWVTIANGKIWRGELKNKAKDGTAYWVDTTIIPFLNEHGKPFQYVAIRSDITERKKSEIEIKKLNEELEQSLKEITDYQYALDESSIVAITDQKGIIKRVNENFCAISKYSQEELIGQDHRIVNSGYHPKEFIRELWVTIANGKIWRGELKNKAKDGTAYWVDTTIIPFLNEHGKPFQYVAIRSDITERKKSEIEVRKLNIKLEERVKEISDYKYALDASAIVAITDQKGIIKKVNDNFCSISKYERSELIGQDHRIINSGYHSKEFIRNLWVTIANGKIWQGELKNKAKDGTIYWVDTTIVPFLNKEGKPFQYIAIRSDITERKKSEIEIKKLNEELEQKVQERTANLESINKELDAFTYSVSHDLRAPLRAVNGYAEILNEEYGTNLDENGKRIIGVIRYNATRMGMLIDDLLTFSRLGKKELRSNNIDMNKLVEEVLNQVNNYISHKAEIRVGNLHNVNADYTLLQQVLYNLISNAIKYSSKQESPVVEVFSEKKNSEVVFSVKDNGVGFDMQYVNKLFGVFQRLHSQDEFEGTGVGLAIVHRVITKHKGRVWAEGKLSEGAVFKFSLSV